MAFSPEESSSTLLPARQVFIKTKNSSQALRTGLAMPAYTIQRNAPWIASGDNRDSMYSEDEYGDRTPSPVKADMPTGLSSKSSYHPSYHAHPQQQIQDHGPQVRQSRLPIFKQVRHMLQKPQTPADGGSRYDEFAGDLSEQGKLAQNPKPSTKPYEGVFKTSKSRSPDRRSNSPSKLRKQRKKRDLSPISILRDDEIKPVVPLKAGMCSPGFVSPVSPVSPLSSRPPTALSENERSINPVAGPPTSSSTKQIKRKPTPSSILSSSQAENRAPPSAARRNMSGRSDWTEPPMNDWEMERSEQLQVPNSHFTWSTQAGSVNVGRPSVDTNMSKSPKMPNSDEREPNKSHFSWSTVNTTTTHAGGTVDSATPSPVPAIPAKYASRQLKAQAAPAYQGPQVTPYQSIVSRPRPIPRPEETCTPPRKSSMPPLSDSVTSTPISVHSGKNGGLHPAYRATSPLSTTTSPTTVSTATGTKSLPPPPTPEGPQSHLEKLAAEEQNLQLRRRNAEKAIADLEKVEKASPMEVSFAAVREAKEKLKEHRENLADILQQERAVGISISRARRKEGMDEGLWVRRVVS